MKIADEFDPKFLEEAGKKKKKESWKRSLFSWLKNGDKKNKVERRHGVFSGVHGGGRSREAAAEGDGSRTPYVNLRKINSSSLVESQPYGPVYFVP